MATPRTGRPRGAPKKAFLTDPDGHLLAFIGAAMALYRLKFEHAALLALGLESKPVELPPDPLRHVRRLKLSQATLRMLQEGWQLRSYERIKPRQTTGGRIDTLRKKAKRLASDPSAQAWLYNIRNAYILILRDGLAAEPIILAFAEAAGERPYFEKLLAFMRPVAKNP